MFENRSISVNIIVLVKRRRARIRNKFPFHERCARLGLRRHVQTMKDRQSPSVLRFIAWLHSSLACLARQSSMRSGPP